MALTDGILELDGFFSDFSKDLDFKFANDSIATNIIEFLNNEVDVESWLGPGGALSDRQRVVLKCYDGMELDDSELALLEAWVGLDRTTYDLKMSPKKRQALVIECGRSGGKCQKLDNLVQTELGLQYLYETLLMPIKSNSLSMTELGLLSKEEIATKLSAQVKPGCSAPITLSVAIEGTNKKAQASHFYVKGQSETRIATTASGFSIEATPEHRVKVLDKEGNIVWRYLGDMVVGEYACIHRATSMFPQQYLNLESFSDTYYKHPASKDTSLPTTLDTNLGYLMGILVANGSWTVQGSVQVTFHKQDIQNYRDAFTKTSLTPYTEGYDSRSQYAARLQYYSTEYRSLLDYLGWTIASKPNTKKTPWAIRQSPKDVQASYLSGLFDGDGTIDKSGRRVSFSTASKTLAVETQLMLLNFGIVSSFHERIVKDKPYYILSLVGKRSLKLFAQEIGFKLPRKQQPVEAYITSHTAEKDETERIPYQMEWLKRLRNTLPENKGKQPGSRKALISYEGQALQTLRNFRAEYRVIVGNCIKEKCGEMLSSYRLNRLVPFAEQFCDDPDAVEHFKYIQDCDYFYDPVVSVEESEAFCVDLSVPGCEQYVAQGMTNHNTFLGAVILGYEWYKLCMLENPQRYFGVAANTLISIYCLAPAASQTKKTIFGQARAFLNYIPKVKRLIDNKIIIVGEEEVKYPDKLLYIYAGNSKGSSQVGSRVILLVMDEVARFENKDGDSNALELWSNIGVSGITFGQHARRVAISSAWCEGDAIQRLWNAAKNELSWVGFRFRTWDLNPAMGRDNPIIVSEYNLNAQAAGLEFEGDRSVNSFTFFNESEIQQAFIGHVQADIERTPLEGDGLVRLKVNSIQASSAQTYMHLDPAVTRDAYGMVFGHGETKEGQKVVVIDGLAAWEPDVSNVVSIMNVYEVIYQIHSARHIYKLTTDHAQQQETIQRLRMAGINASSRFWSNRVQVEIYDFTRKMLHEGRVVLPKNSPWTHLLKLEMMGVVHDKERNKIIHRNDGSKDILDCLCSVVWEIAGNSQGVSGSTVIRNHSWDKYQPKGGAPRYKDEEFSSDRKELVANAKRYRGNFSTEYDF